jgi:hypothetical protein
MPLGGLANRLTILCNQSGHYVSYESDEFGFRNPRDVWKSARADLAVIGQSFAQGYCLPDGKTFVDLLRHDYPVTLNLGTSGQSALRQLAAIKEYLATREPKTVLWIFSEWNDLIMLFDEARHPVLRRYAEPAFTQNLLERQPEIEQRLQRVVNDMQADAQKVAQSAGKRDPLDRSLVRFVKLRHLRAMIRSRYRPDPMEARGLSMLESRDNLLNEALQQAKTVTASWGGTLYFVYLPSWKRYDDGERLAEFERTKVLALVRALGIPVIDAHPSFAAYGDPLSLFPFRRFGHYNEEGNRIVAVTIRNTLRAGPAIATLD